MHILSLGRRLWAQSPSMLCAFYLYYYVKSYESCTEWTIEWAIIFVRDLLALSIRWFTSITSGFTDFYLYSRARIPESCVVTTHDDLGIQRENNPLSLATLWDLDLGEFHLTCDLWGSGRRGKKSSSTYIATPVLVQSMF